MSQDSKTREDLLFELEQIKRADEDHFLSLLDEIREAQLLLQDLITHLSHTSDTCAMHQFIPRARGQIMLVKVAICNLGTVCCNGVSTSYTPWREKRHVLALADPSPARL